MQNALSFARPTFLPSGEARRPLAAAERPLPCPRVTPTPLPTAERLELARERIAAAAHAGERIRAYEVALDFDMSEFHFARLFRAAFGRSPHVYYDELRAERARALLADGSSESEAARRIGLRRPAELRQLLAKRLGAIESTCLAARG